MSTPSETVFPIIVFETPFDERAQFEAKARGYLSHAKIRESDGSVYSVVFYDPVRLSQDLEYEVSIGKMCIADAGMIVLPEVTLENITTAVRSLADEGFFRRLKSIARA